jgi:hypothetical protein
LLVEGVDESWKRFAGARAPGRGEALLGMVLAGTRTFSRRKTGFFAPPKKLFIIASRRLRAFKECRWCCWNKGGERNVVSVSARRIVYAV